MNRLTIVGFARHQQMEQRRPLRHSTSLRTESVRGEIRRRKSSSRVGDFGVYSGTPGWGGRRHFFRSLKTGKSNFSQPNRGYQNGPLQLPLVPAKGRFQISMASN
ncbi:hypothetical protein AVEN_26313-1 [Araneus ventricosus]|uniref:Uncharacterized protein n=1 Tax=Araneus ventricosus TaxID=182803 RepID=A0A4Y2AM91_ARAVE|nr:hypothetical protein AVEN_26313-1 [Araneus ventricosus]